LVVSCGGSDKKGSPGPGAAANLVGVWFSGGQYGEHTLYLDTAHRFMDAASVFVTYPDLDPWTLDPVIMAANDVTMGSYTVADGAIRFTYFDNGRSETFTLATEGLSTTTHEDDLLMIGGRPYLWSEAMAGTLPDVPEVAGAGVEVTDATGSYDLYILSCAESVLETDYFGTMPITLLFQSFGGFSLEMRLADYRMITLGQPVAFDGGAAFGVDCTLDVREGLFVFYADQSAGSITFTKFQQVGSVVYVSGMVAPTVLFDTWDEQRSVTVEASFVDVPVRLVY
jgi:hypothetical protein